jgi:hypothetical protein
MQVVYPTSATTPEIGIHAPLLRSELGRFFAGEPEANCALCEIGCCLQRYVFDTTCDEPIVIHGVLGEA